MSLLMYRSWCGDLEMIGTRGLNIESGLKWLGFRECMSFFAV